MMNTDISTIFSKYSNFYRALRSFVKSTSIY